MKHPPASAVEVLNRFGRTLDNRAKWRVIWSKDKLSIADGKMQLEYAHIHPTWVLEKWCDNTIGPEEWDKTKDPETGEYILGPYTSGTYEMAYAFPPGVDLSSTVVESIPLMINAGLERFTFSQRLNSCRERLDKAEKAWESRFSDIYDDAQDAFKGQAFSGAHGHRIRGPEDIKITVSTDDLPAELAKQRGIGQLS